MKKFIYPAIFYFILFGIVGCKKIINKLSHEDLSWNSYRGDETLVFSSNNSRLDTIFLRGTKQYLYSGDPLDPSPDSLEQFELLYKHSNLGIKEPNDVILNIQKTRDNNTMIGF